MEDQPSDAFPKSAFPSLGVPSSGTSLSATAEDAATTCAEVAPPRELETSLASGREVIARRAAWRAGLAALGIAVGYLAFWRITLWIPSSVIGMVLTTTLLSLVLVLLFTVRMAQALRSPTALGLHLTLSGMLVLPMVLAPLMMARYPQWAGWPVWGPRYALYHHGLTALIPGLGSLLMIWFATSVGVLVSRLIREMKILLPIAVVLALVDLYVVFGGGLVTQAQRGNAPVAQAAMEAFTVRLRPKVRPIGGAAPMNLAVGFADFLFIGLFFACFARFGIPSRSTFVVLCVVLCIYMLIVAQTGCPLPALVPIAVVVIGMNLRAFRYARSEAFALLYAGLLVAALLGGMLFFAHR